MDLSIETFNAVMKTLDRSGWIMIYVFIALVLLAGIIILFWRSREKINWKFILVLSVLYFMVLFLDIGSSTPYAMASCDGQAYETNAVLRFLMQQIGWISYPVMIVFNYTMGVSFLIISNYLSNLPKKDYWRGFIMSFIMGFLALIFYLHIYSAINNYTLCS